MFRQGCLLGEQMVPAWQARGAAPAVFSDTRWIVQRIVIGGPLVVLHSHQSRLDRVASEFNPIANRELLENIGQMSFDRALAE